MNTLQVESVRYFGIQSSTKDEYLLMLPNKSEHHNQIDMIHASVQFALAEATSVEFLKQELNAIDIEAIPVVRKSEVLFCCPADGELFSKAYYADTTRTDLEKHLVFHNRVVVSIKVDLFNSLSEKVMESTFDWFFSKL